MSKTPRTTKKAKSKANKPATDRPFTPAILRAARELAASYRLLIEPDAEVGYLGRTVELPYAMGDGETIEACVATTMEATVSVVATLLENGERPPTPASEARRDRQVNIRLTADEKERLDEAARAAGFRSVSDYIRHAALKSA
ncbi:MAG: ribbon-helix-helix protein, CopG family [Phycisphaeraceae bacterium]|nr:MAG: ribbon-helix-helix protein, CopG family [Phycisphaeraceae bacterium]